MKKSVIENEFKEKLSAREITPLAGSWDRLDAMLTVAEKPKRNFKWIYVAASVLGFLLISTLFFNQDQKGTVVTKDIIVVNEPKKVLETKESTAIKNVVERVEPVKVAAVQLVSNDIIKDSDSNNVSIKNEIQIAQKEEIQEQQIPIISQKAEQQVVLRKSKYVNVDELLASVDPLSKKKNSSILQSNVKVNSKELLSQVDDELELSFREKALKVVNQKIKTATVALSNRNSE